MSKVLNGWTHTDERQMMFVDFQVKLTFLGPACLQMTICCTQILTADKTSTEFSSLARKIIIG